MIHGEGGEVSPMRMRAPGGATEYPSAPPPAGASAQDDRFRLFILATGQMSWTAAPDGTTRDVAAWCAYTGQREAEARGTGWLDAVHPDDRPLVALEWVRAIEGRGTYEVEYRLRRFDGAYRDVLARALPLFDAAGGVREWLGFCTDLTAHRLQERRTTEALHALLAIAEVLVLPREASGNGWTPGGHPVGRRLAELTRHVLGCERIVIAALDPAADPASWTFTPFAAAGLSPEQEGRWRAELAGRGPRGCLPAATIEKLQAGEVALDDLDGAAREWVGPRTLLVPLLVGAECVGLLGAGYPAERRVFTEDEVALALAVARLTALVLDRDRLLHERAEARASELAMREAKREMDEFLSIASHELKTPLTSIRGFIQLAEQRLKGLASDEHEALQSLQEQEATTAAYTAVPGQPDRYERVRAVLERAEHQTGQMTRLINELLEASRVHASRMELRLARRDLAAVVRDVIEEQRLAWPGRGIALEAPDERVSVLVDAGRIGQVLTNFLTNALKYAPADSPVLVRLAVADGAGDGDPRRAHVSVRDFGPGLEPEARARIWERFYRAPEVRAQRGGEGGLGLGLYITRGIVERHGGAVGVESAPGAGATFFFTLPLAE